MSAASQLVPQACVTGTVLAFDFGTRRIGVAIGERLLGQARALTTIESEENAARLPRSPD